jgi:hypothetical protein
VHSVETVWGWPGRQSARVRTDYGRLLVSVDGGPEMVVQHGAMARPEGDRPHLYCPLCDRAVFHLYLVDDLLQCRHCAGLVYAVQYGRQWCPALQRVHKLRARLGADLAPFGPLPSRPWDGRSIRWYDRLVAQIQEAEAEVLEALRKTTAIVAKRHGGKR